MKSGPHWIYAMYKGDNFICDGTREEICKQANISLATFRMYRCNWYRINKQSKSNKSRFIIRIDGEDRIYSCND